MHRVEGRLQLEELRDLLREVYQDSGFDAEADVLWDVREADLTAFSAEDVRGMADFVGRHWGTAGRSRAALVVARDVEYGLTRMYGQYLDGRTTSEVRVFRDYDAAIEWLAG